jgi:hypothetical protein
MTATQIEPNLRFPARQATHEGHWLPVYLEPLPGSGERICIGVIATDGDSVEVAEVPELHRLQAIYGTATASLLWAARLAMLEASALAKSEGLGGLRQLQSRMEGLYVGDEIRRGAGRNLTNLAAIALQQASPFASLKATGMNVPEMESQSTRPSPLVAAIKNSVTSVRHDLRGAFQRSYKFAEHTRPTVYGFVGRRLIANFASLGGTRAVVTNQVDTAKARLWDLKHLRDGVLREVLAQPMADRAFELLVCPPVRKGFVQKLRDEANISDIAEAAELLEREADRFDLRCRRLASANDAAHEIVSREAAA